MELACAGVCGRRECVWEEFGTSLPPEVCIISQFIWALMGVNDIHSSRVRGTNKNSNSSFFKMNIERKNIF